MFGLGFKGKVDRAVGVLEKGGVIAYPTDTLYGLGVDAFNKQAVEKLFNLKKRKFNKPLSVALSSVDKIESVADVGRDEMEIIKKYLPGPYTFLLKNIHVVSDVVTAYSGKIGVRVPENKLALEIIKTFGKPITSTSANYSGEEPPKTYGQIKINVDYIVKGRCKHRAPSTMVDLIKKEVVREGAGKFSY